MTSWKSKLLSRAGKLVLIQAILSTIPSYSHSTLLLPKSIHKTIDQSLSNFFQGSNTTNNPKIRLINWDKLARLKFEGGLGLIKSKIANFIAIVKLAWRLHNNTNLAHKINQHKYCKEDGSLLNFKLGPQIWQTNFRINSKLLLVSVILQTPTFFSRWIIGVILALSETLSTVLSTLRKTNSELRM